MAILVTETEPEIIDPELEELFAQDMTAEDFIYPEHKPEWSWPGVCGICGQLHPALALPPEAVNDLGGQSEAPRFGADEYLSW